MARFKVVGVWLCLALGLLTSSARADMCLSGGGDPDEKSKGGAGNAGQPGEAGDAGAAGATSELTPVKQRRYAGGSLVFVGALGSIWMLARRRGKAPPSASLQE